MVIVELPVLPSVSALDGTTFESVLLCRFVSLTGRNRRLDKSQRQILSMFNRSGQKSVSNYFRKAQSKRFISKVSASSGADPDEYVRGEFFLQQTSESRALISLANSLWGSKGLLRSWPYPTAWGHGCLLPAAILILATLRVLDESISKRSLRRYLTPLVKESSFNNGIKFLVKQHLVFGDCDRLKIAPDWEAKMRTILDSVPACNGRQIKGDLRRKHESEKNRMRVARNELTDAERTQLLTLPCVVKGCSRKSREAEHFPPRHFLKQIKVITNRHFVWSICKRHNHEMQAFIKGLSTTTEIRPNKLVLMPGVDPMRIYSASANRWIQRFYKAYSDKEVSAAQEAITMTLGLWKAIDLLPSGREGLLSCPAFKSLRTIGSRAYIPERSQLPFRAGLFG